MACIHDEIAAMPMGYHTRLGEGGGGLSGGQRQRLALARAVVRRPRLLLLDEATSHLDTLTEERIDAALDASGITRVVVAHRLSTVRSPDRIVVLDQVPEEVQSDFLDCMHEAATPEEPEGDPALDCAVDEPYQSLDDLFVCPSDEVAFDPRARCAQAMLCEPGAPCDCAFGVIPFGPDGFPVHPGTFRLLP